MVIEWLGAASILVGCFFMLVAAVGLARLPDVFTRLHAATKAGTTGVAFMMLGLMCFYQAPSVITRAVAVLFFLALTAPVSAHMIGRAAYVANVRMWEGTFVDELADYYAARERASTDSTDQASD